MSTSAFVTYGSFNFLGDKGYPVPFVSISKDYQRNGAGKTIGETTSVTLEGLLFTGSGNSGLPRLLSLESGLRAAFIDGGTLTIGCGSTNSTFSGGKVSQYSANKTNNNWTTTIDYSISLQFENSVDTGTPAFYVSSTQDEWSIETLDETSFAQGPFGLSSFMPGYTTFTFDQGKSYPFYRITRTLGAVGKAIPNTGTIPSISAVASAKNWVNYQLGEPPSYSGVVGLKLYNFVRSLSVSENEGSFRVTDNWIGVPHEVNIPYIETFNIDSSVDLELTRTVTVQGTVKGLEVFNSGNIYNKNLLTYLGGNLSGSIKQLTDNNIHVGGTNGTKFFNALSGYATIKANNILLDRVKSAAATGSLQSLGYCLGPTTSGVRPMNPIPMSVTEGLNPTEGTVTYNWVFNNRPQPLVSGAISERLTIDDRHATPMIASVFVLGRRLGPILQDLGTFSASSRTVSFEVVLPKPSSIRDLVFPTQHYHTITGVVDSFNPLNFAYGVAGAQGIKSYISANNSNWDPLEGRLSTNKTWEWVRCIE
jgi:hypothetical protein